MDTGQLRQYEPTTPFFKRQGDGGPIAQLRIDNWPEAKYVGDYGGGAFGG
jgi:hypothetical protein